MPIGKRFVVAGYENDKMIEPTPIGEERDKMRFHPKTEQGKQWEGWGTALKPACEPIVVARKPLSEKNVASTILTALENVRAATWPVTIWDLSGTSRTVKFLPTKPFYYPTAYEKGRPIEWYANLVMQIVTLS